VILEFEVDERGSDLSYCTCQFMQPSGVGRGHSLSLTERVSFGNVVNSSASRRQWTFCAISVWTARCAALTETIPCQALGLSFGSHTDHPPVPRYLRTQQMLDVWSLDSGDSRRRYRLWPL